MRLEGAGGSNLRKSRVEREGFLAAALALMNPSSKVHLREVKMRAARGLQFANQDMQDNLIVT